MNTNPTRLTTLMAAAALASAAFIAVAPAHAECLGAAAAEPAVQQVVVTAKRLPKAETIPVQRVIVTAKRLPRPLATAGSAGSGRLRPTAAPAR